MISFSDSKVTPLILHERITRYVSVELDVKDPDYAALREQLPRVMNMPYLSDNFTFVEKKQGKTPFLKHIFVVNSGNMVSAGINAGLGVTGMKYSLDKIINSITRSFSSSGNVTAPIIVVMLG